MGKKELSKGGGDGEKCFLKSMYTPELSVYVHCPDSAVVLINAIHIVFLSYIDEFLLLKDDVES